VALLFAPLALQGLLDDLVQGVRNARRSVYADRTSMALSRVVRLELEDGRIAGLLAGLGLLAFFAPSRRLIRTWAVALLLGLIYKPLHPVAHEYLNHPVQLIWSLSLALAVGLLFDIRWSPRWWHVLAVPLALVVGLRGLTIPPPVNPSNQAKARKPRPWIPRFCRVGASLQAISDLARGRVSERDPPGTEGYFRPFLSYADYAWDEARGALVYLRTMTKPTTRVANVLRGYPPVSLNGASGRISPFPAESGVLWLWQVNPDLEPAFIQALDACPDSVVVWVPNERSFDPKLQLDALAKAIRARYVRDTGFRRIEVWRRRGNEK
jgi:hypothetical protein